MATWLRDYPMSVEGVSDSLGRKPRHSFFYPAEAYSARVVDSLAKLCHDGYGEVDVHLHHHNDTSDGFVEKITSFIEILYNEHGLLERDSEGRLRYGFIHGNWALDNSRPDGCWCGVNNEIDLLIETGCYADFTLPSAPSPGQTRMVNSIYYTEGGNCQPKSHDWGQPARVGSPARDDALLMIQGPLAWNLTRRKWGVLPRLENGDLHRANVPTLERFKLWLAAAVSVVNRPDWRFVKLHTHGAMEENIHLLLHGPMRRFHEQLATYAASRPGFNYYYVTAREMAILVHAAEAGETDPAAVLTPASCLSKEWA